VPQLRAANMRLRHLAHARSGKFPILLAYPKWMGRRGVIE
jgi:hypothetical protein